MHATQIKCAALELVMYIGWQELLIFLVFALCLFRGSRLRELTKFGGLAYVYKYPGLRVATRVVSPPSAFEWITIAAVIVLTILVVLAG
jgi:hypothetical protein